MSDSDDFNPNSSEFNDIINSDPLLQYLFCAIRGDREPELQGFAVRLSIYITNICIASLIAWSPRSHGIQESVNVLMIQVYTILICTAIGIAKRDMSVSDVHTALSLTVSPVAIYLLYATFFRFLRKRKNHLYDRLHNKVVVCLLTIGMVLFWLAIDFIIFFGKFTSETEEGIQRCKPTVHAWLFYIYVTQANAFELSVFTMPILPFFYFIYFLRHRRDIIAEWRRHMDPKRDASFMKRIWLSLKYCVVAQWDVIALSHRWMFFVTVLIAYVAWAGSLYIWAIDQAKWIHDQIMNEVGRNNEPYKAKHFDALGYSQLLAAGLAFEPIYAVLRMTVIRRHDAWCWLRYDMPAIVWDDIVFVATGSDTRNPWKKVLRKREEAKGMAGELLAPELGIREKVSMGDLSIKDELIEHC